MNGYRLVEPGDAVKTSEVRKMNLESALLGLLVALLTPWLMNLLSGRERPARQVDGFKVLEYPMALRGFSLVLGLLCLGAAALAFWVPGRFPPGSFFLAGLANVSLYFVLGRASLFWSEHHLKGPDAIGKSVEMPWADVVSVEYVSWAMGYRLRNGRGTSIWFSSLMNGFDEFMEEVEARGLA